MKKISAIILIIVMIASFAGCGSKSAESSAASSTEVQTTEARTTQPETITSDMKSKLDKVLTDANYKGVLQISKGGSVVYQYTKGNDDNGKPLTIGASMPIGSVSKQFCAACVMLLCDQKKLSVDDTLDKYFPEYKNGKKMTIKNLLNMSSGLTNFLELINPVDIGTNEKENIQKIKKAIFDKELNFEPGSDYQYSNSNYFLLADIVEQVSGVTYKDYLRKNFFEPFEMTHTGFTDEVTENHEWTFALSKTESIEEGFYNPGITKGAGDIVSNAEDMDKWMRGFKQMTQTVNPNSTEEYCYGFWHMPYGGSGHIGQIPPHFGAVDYINTERDVYLFAVSNSGRGMSYVQEIPQTLLSVLFEQ